MAPSVSSESWTGEYETSRPFVKSSSPPRVTSSNPILVSARKSPSMKRSAAVADAASSASSPSAKMTRAEMVKAECINADPEFMNYLDDKGRISVKQLRETPKLRHLYKIYDRVSVQLCRAERRRNVQPPTPPSSPPSTTMSDLPSDEEEMPMVIEDVKPVIIPTSPEVNESIRHGKDVLHAAEVLVWLAQAQANSRRPGLAV